MARQAERSQTTRRALIEAGRHLFAERGYREVATQDIVAAAGVTRGALYHHFRDKLDLFRAVHEDVEARLTERIGAQLAAAGASDPGSLLVEGTRAFLDACTDPEVARIALAEAPGVLGWEEWREIEERYGLGLVVASLTAAMEAGAIARQPVKPLAVILLAALSQAGLMIANSENPRDTRVEAEEALLSLLEGLSAG